MGRNLEDVASGDSHSVQDFDQVGLACRGVQVADEVRLSELTVRAVEQNASHHEEECSDADTQSQRFREVSLLVLHLGVDFQRHSVAFEGESCDTEEVRQPKKIELLEVLLEGRHVDLVDRSEPDSGNGYH